MHQVMASTLEQAIGEIRDIQRTARQSTNGNVTRPRWPMIVLRTPERVDRP